MVENESLHASLVAYHQPTAGDPGQGSFETDDLVAAPAVNLQTVAEEREVVEPPAVFLNPVARQFDFLGPPNLTRATATDLAALAALTGDPSSWACVISRGETYNGAAAGELLEEIGMADREGRIHPATRSQRTSLTRSLPYPGRGSMPLSRSSKAVIEEMPDSVYLNDATIRVDSMNDSGILREELAAEANFLSKFDGKEVSDDAGKSSYSGIDFVVIHQLRPFAAAIEEDFEDVPAGLSQPGFAGLRVDLFKPFIAEGQNDCMPWMVEERPSSNLSSYGSGINRPHVSPLGRASPFLGGAVPLIPVPPRVRTTNGPEKTIYVENDRLESTYDASLILPEPVGVGSSFFSPFATAAMTHFDETPKVRFGPDVRETTRSGLGLQTAMSAAQSRVRAVSNQLLDIVASMTPNASAALRSTSVLVVPVMPASVFEHSIGSKPCFEASPPSPSNIAYMLVSVLLVLGLIGSSIAENYLTIQ